MKAIRAGRAQIGEGYVMVRGEELFLIGAHISPLPTASTHFTPDPTRTRKLLMHAEEIRRLIGKVEQRGYTLIPLNLHYTKGRIKLELGLAKGKLQHDKRADEREKEWNREKQRLLRSIADFLAGARRFGERHPGRDHGIGVERHALDALLHQPAREVGMVGGPLAADADVLAVLAAGADRHGEHRLDGRVALVEALGDEARIAVQAERELGQVVRADREAVEELEELARPASRWTAARTS